MREITTTFKALANERRLKILVLLSEKRMPVMDISKGIKLSFKCVSRHLQKLENAKLVKHKQEGKWVYYSLRRKSKLFLKEIFLNYKNNLEDS